MNKKPTIIGDGYCIFDIEDAIPGKWTVLLQYSTNERMGGTIGGFEKNPAIQIESVSAHDTDALSPASIRFHIKDCDGAPVTDASVTAKITKFAVSTESLLKKYAGRLTGVDIARTDSDAEDMNLQKLEVFRQQHLHDTGEDIRKMSQAYTFLKNNGDGVYECNLRDVDTMNNCVDSKDNKGIYTFECKIEGINPKTNYPYTYYKTHAIVIE